MRDVNNRDQEARLSRRQFLSRAGAASLSMTFLGKAMAQVGKTDKLILGVGSNRYECIHDWLTPPSNILYGDTHGLAQDSKGRIYVGHTVHPSSPTGSAICVFDEKGGFIEAWGSQFRGGSHGLDVRKEGHEEFLYHCDIANRRVVKTGLDGTFVFELGLPKEAGVYKEGNPYVPTNIAFSPNGDFYVADGYGSHWIHQYDIKGNYIRTFGGYGKEPGKVAQPHGIWLDDRGKEPLLAVADRANSRIQYFSLDGKHVGFVTNGMRQPCHFSIRKGVMLVPDLKSVVTLLDHENKVMVQLGDGDPSNLRDASRSSFIPGKFIHPHDAIFLRNGDILVAEWVPIGRITLLKKIR